MKKSQNLRAVVGQLKPIVRDLLALEKDARLIDEQIRRIPLGWKGAEEEIERQCQDAVDKRFAKIVGAKVNAEFAHGDLIRRLLDNIAALAAAAGVAIDCGRLERNVKVWVDHYDLYDAVTHSRSELAVRVRLNADGSLKRRG